MKILLVHPDDSPETGAWAQTRWDLAFDLGWSGDYAYKQLSERLGYPVSSIYDLPDHGRHRDQLREILGHGLDRLIDSCSIDWWDIYCGQALRHIEETLLLAALAERIPKNAEIFASRPHSTLQTLSLLLNRGINIFQADRDQADFTPRLLNRSRRYLKAALALRPAQIREIAFDKWDADYRLRRHFAPRPENSSSPAILLPSAYVNVSRTQAACARMLPHRSFLLVVTRRSGAIQDLPANVHLRWLSSYAPRPSRSSKDESAALLEGWQRVQEDLFESNHVLRLAMKLRAFDGFAAFVKLALGIRDAWREVLAREPIVSVLSSDEHNPYTRLPILLARSRHRPTVFCDHGALGCSFAFRQLASDSYLVKGDMARDYNVAWCGVPAERVVVGAPNASHPLSPTVQRERDWIVFYSEAYELSSGRSRTLYAEILPELCSLARQTNRKIIVKLHPFENGRERRAIIDKVLSPEDKNLVDVREGPITAEMFQRAWCSLTVESSVAVESTLNRVPCFLLSWFDASWYDYGKQYAKFSAGIPLDSPKAIREIPALLEGLKISADTCQRLQTPITPDHLEAILSGRQYDAKVKIS